MAVVSKKHKHSAFDDALLYRVGDNSITFLLTSSTLEQHGQLCSAVVRLLLPPSRTKPS